MSEDPSGLTGDSTTEEYVTFTIGGQLFGLPIHDVQDVFIPHAITKVPLASSEIAGVMNLRGRIVTAIDLRPRLDLPRTGESERQMAVGLDHGGEAYGLIIDEVVEVLRLSRSALESNPVNLGPRWASVSAGVYRLDGSLMVVFDIEKILAASEQKFAA